MQKIVVCVIFLTSIMGLIMAEPPAQPLRNIAGVFQLSLIDFNALDGKLDNGYSCEMFGGKCDPYFDICVKLPIRKICSILRAQKGPFNNRNYIANVSTFNIELPVPVPRKYEVIVRVHEHDSSGFQGNALIGYFHSIIKLIVVPFTSRIIPYQYFIMSRPQGYRRNRVSLKLKAAIICEKYFYGDYCEYICQPKKGQYKCTPNGQKICNEEYTGVDCDQRNFCKNQTLCAYNAKCVNLEEKYKCVCDKNSTDGKDKRCYAGYDFCSEFQCHNGGSCVNQWQRPQCKCTTTHTGTNCQYYAKRCQDHHCQNNGSCAVKSNGAIICLCQDGFGGLYCQKSVTIAPSSMIPPHVKFNLSDPFWSSYHAYNNKEKESWDSQLFPNNLTTIILITILVLFGLTCLASVIIVKRYRDHERIMKDRQNNFRTSIKYGRASFDTTNTSMGGVLTPRPLSQDFYYTQVLPRGNIMEMSTYEECYEKIDGDNCNNDNNADPAVYGDRTQILPPLPQRDYLTT